jgi:1,3-beta-glucan synthase
MRPTHIDFRTVLFLGTLMESVPICNYINGQLSPNQNGCYNLFPVFDWIKRCMISIFLVFMIAFLPLFIQGSYQH